MKTKEKAYFRRQIIENDKQNIFNLSKDFYELDWYDITSYEELVKIAKQIDEFIWSENDKYITE